MEWTDEQLDIIEVRDREILVSAAAGSGKTSVLVERIFRQIADTDDPVDIDRFVVVTYTHAAANEMKERLRHRIETALSENTLPPSCKKHLRRQLRLLPSAPISTVHSFCNYVIGQYFHRIGIDPGLTLASETECRLLQHEVIEKLLALEYEEEQEDFLHLAELYSLNRTDDHLENWILQIYNKMMSEPFPDLLAERWKRILTTPVEDETSPYIDELLQLFFHLFQDMPERCQQLSATYGNLEEKHFRTIRVLTDASLIIKEKEEKYKNKTTDRNRLYEEVRLLLMSLDFSGLPNSSKKEALYDACRDVYPLRTALEEYRDSFFISISELETERQQMAAGCLPILRLACRFSEMFAEAKRERGLQDFNDLEQFALKILYDRQEDGHYVRSDAARELAEQFREIMIDEYQDSNRVQDTILWAVSTSRPDRSTSETEDTSCEIPPWERSSQNRFMVGDIKQSIYRFRNACPELFENKLKKATTALNRERDSSGRRIREKGAPPLRLNLSTNFRSAPIIIDATNQVFKKVMHEDIGGVEYSRDEWLSRGAKLPETEPAGPIATHVEIDEYILPDGMRNNTRAEATHIALRIRAMVEGDEPLYIRDKENYRRVRYRDIAILSRAVSPIASEYGEVFRKLGIPFFTKQTEGFYGSREVTLILEMLTVIDNPHQDIPLAGVLLSPIAGLSEEDLSRIFIATQNQTCDLYDRLVIAADHPDSLPADDSADELVTRIRIFLEFLRELREEAPLSTVSSLLDRFLGQTGLYEMFAAQPDGKRRCTNIDYLMHTVNEFDRGSFQGVHAFIEYIHRITSRDEDAGEPLSIGDADDVVRLMSVHKSKGLEFPVVIIPRMDSNGAGNQSGRFITDPELGLAGYLDNEEKGLYKKPVFYALLRKKCEREDRGELLRLFYVAMTRAKDQLILIREHTEITDEPDIGTFGRMAMKSFFSILAPAVWDDTQGELFQTRIIESEEELSASLPSDDNRPASPSEHGSAEKEEFNIFDTSNDYNKPLSAELPDPLPVKISVSDLKKESYEDEIAVGLYTEPEPDALSAPHPDEQPGGTDPSLLPRFLLSDQPSALTGATRGTIYHQVMATLDLAAFHRDADDTMQSADKTDAPDYPDHVSSLLQTQMKRLVTDHHLPAEEAEVIQPAKIEKFLTSPLGERLITADRKGKLHREQPFILSKPADEIERFRERGETTPIMIQGIIDVYFEEEDGIVLVDYKTDRIRAGEEDSLIRRYRIQMELYREALETVWSKPVKECWLYSFSLNRAIAVDAGGTER